MRAILFDFGGTLDGPGEPWIDRFTWAYRQTGLSIDDGELRAAVGYGTRQAYRTPAVAKFSLAETVGFHVACQFAHLKIEDPATSNAIATAFLDRTESAMTENRPVLARLAARFRLGVVSNFYGNVEGILAGAGFRPLLGAVIDSTVVGVSKPDPRIFAMAIERLDVPAAATLYVGDSLDQDIAPARAAGLRTAWVTKRTDAPAPPPDLRIATLSDLERLI
ncbi:MAG TPA: HAD family hydrolase [Pseudomonadales bacterium]|nr:HAD family hydrolase [Pseudomonadales bacterium]